MALSIVPETYSKSDTVPIRSFAGYDTITYYMDNQSTINSGTTITIPAGITFKTNYYYYTPLTVNGRLNILGTAQKPVVFTDFRDDAYGNPKDMNQDGNATSPSINSNEYIQFNDVSDDASVIRHAIFRYSSNGIGMYSASPRIVSSTFEYNNTGIYMTGVSAPSIDSCIFRNSGPISISLVSYPSSTVNDTLEGTTWKCIAVNDETLAQDVTLPQRTFAGIKNIPYPSISTNLKPGPAGRWSCRLNRSTTMTWR